MKTKKVEVKDKPARCIHAHPDFTDIHAWNCFVNGLEDKDVRQVTKDDCEKCGKYKSRYIEYPLTIQGIENAEIDGHDAKDCGCLCEVKPCSEEYHGKTYLGFYLGRFPISIYSSYDEKTGILNNRAMTNPAIFIPELKKIIYGAESWWRKIDKIEDFQGITDEDIENTWYVRLLKEQSQ